MPLSISSSNGRLPEGPWGRTWMLVLASALLVLAAYEVIGRSLGARPSVTDDASLWAMTRERASTDDPRTLVIVGSSGALNNIDLSALGEATHRGHPVQLAIAGGSPLPAIRHLAADDKFKGLLICEVIPLYFLEGTKAPEAKAKQWVAYYENRSWDDGLGKTLELFIETTLVIRNSELFPPRLAKILLLPEHQRSPGWRVTMPDRSCRSDFGGMNSQFLHRIHAETCASLGKPASAEELRRLLTDLEEMVDRIEHRGGRVVYVHFPMSLVIREIAEKRYPRRQYWDALANQTKAVCIHFEDYPSLSGMACPDGLHLDQRDVSRFTKSLVEILVEKGVL